MEHPAEDEGYEELNSAITTASAGSIVVKWTLITEFIADDGERYIEARSSLECSPWDELGLLDHRATFVRGRIQIDPPDGD